jgi:hypothetical protein
MAEVVVVVGCLLDGQRLPWAGDMLSRGRGCLGGPDRTPGHRPRPRDLAIGHLLDGRRLPWARNMLAEGRCCLGGPGRTLGHRPRPPDGRTVMAIVRLLWLQCRNRHHIINANAIVIVLIHPS